MIRDMNARITRLERELDDPRREFDLVYEATFSMPGLVTAQWSQPMMTPVNCRLDEIIWTARVADTSNMTFETWRSGTMQDSATIPAGETYRRYRTTSPQYPLPSGLYSDANMTLWSIWFRSNGVTATDCSLTLRFTSG